MKFGAVPIDQAEGKILAHNLSESGHQRIMRKGKKILAEDVALLKAGGIRSVYVAEIESGDIDENHAALQIAEAAIGPGLFLKGLSAGKASLGASFPGTLRVDAARLAQVNSCNGIALATLRSHTVVEKEQTVATVKVIPYALSNAELAETLQSVQGHSPLLQVYELKPQRVALIFAGTRSAQSRLTKTYTLPLQKRVETYGSKIVSSEFVALDGENDEDRLARVLQEQAETKTGLTILVNETSIMDTNDIAPQAVRRAGGELVCVGAPVDPGNLIMVASVGDMPLLAVPGCARSPRINVVDLILPALLSGNLLSREEIYELGHGGLLEF